MPHSDDPVPTHDGLEMVVQVGARTLGLSEFQELIPEDYEGLLTLGEKREYLERWVDTELLYLGAESRGMLDDPDLARRLLSQRRDFIANAFLQKTLDERVGITESELSDYYSTHLEEYAWEYRYRQLIVNSHEEAQKIHREFTGSEISFKRAAEKYSLDASARLGGDMGWMSRAAIPPEILSRLVVMEKNDISEPFETTWGWTFIQFRERRESENALELSAVREEILRHLLIEKRRRVYAEFLEELREAFPVKYHPETDARLGDDSPPVAAP